MDGAVNCFGTEWDVLAEAAGAGEMGRVGQLPLPAQAAVTRPA